MEIFELGSFLAAVTVSGLLKQLVISLIALVNAAIALLAGIAVWRSYLLIASKIFLTIILLIPIVGIVIYVLWGQKRVREAV